MSDTFTKVKDILVEKFNIEQNQIQEDTSLDYDLGIGTFDLLEFIGVVQKEFNIGIPNKMVEDFVTVEDVVNYVDAHRNR
ncbi:MAG: acyl carrier protein [Candidatus Promineifilaceae bacterium]